MKHSFPDIWMCADTIVSPLGLGTKHNFSQLVANQSGIKLKKFGEHDTQSMWVSEIESIEAHSDHSRLEDICLQSLDHVSGISFPAERTLFILSTTKGNIDQHHLAVDQRRRFHLHEVSGFLAKKLGIARHTVISTACISGSLSIIFARRMILAGAIDHAVIVGADILSDFTISGFKALNAISASTCKPFDKYRDGINLGEAAASTVISREPEKLGLTSDIKITGSHITNDANHISGPSRTGSELACAIKESMNEAQCSVSEVDVISAHGTATVYNDEMESKAFYLTGLQEKPILSLKGFYGHTLGAAGLLESIISAECLRQNLLVTSKGYDEPGTSIHLNMVKTNSTMKLKRALKTASGFGGSNAAIILEKVD